MTEELSARADARLLERCPSLKDVVMSLDEAEKLTEDSAFRLCVEDAMKEVREGLEAQVETDGGMTEWTKGLQGALSVFDRHLSQLKEEPKP